MPATVDLPTQLGRTLVAFGREAATEPGFSLPLWANLLRPLDGEARTPGELRATSCVSRRALTPSLKGLHDRGWAVTEGSGRTKATSLTEAGRAVADAWRPVPRALEARWRASMGGVAIDRLRAALVALVSQLPLELPHYPATYGTVDSSITGGGGVGGRGADWKPVRRASGSEEAVAALPVYALLSQALVGFALDYEEEDDGWFVRRGTYFVGAGVLRHVADAGTPVDIPPFRPWLPFWARYMLPRHGLGDIERDPATRADVFRLSDRGRAWRDGHDGEVDRVTARWEATYGQATTAELTDALTALAPNLPAGLPDVPLDA
jgi:DNA-binding MarR family transcriptional regulator